MNTKVIRNFILPDKEAVLSKDFIVKIISSLFYVLFLYAAANKVLDFQKFKVELGQSPILTEYAHIIAWLIPAIELALCVLLLIPKTILAGLYASFSLMTMFTAYIIVILNFTERIPCSCGGIFEKMGWGEHLVFNIAFILLGIAGIILKTRINENKDFNRPN